MVSHHPPKFSCDSYCGSGDVMSLICHMIPQNHVTQELCDFLKEFMGDSGRPSSLFTTAPNFVAINTAVAEI